MPTDTWYSKDQPPTPTPSSLVDWARVVRRGLPLFCIVFGGLLFMLMVRVVERPLNGIHRPWTPWITIGVCRAALKVLGISHKVTGQMMTGQGAMVANHASWLDIFALNAIGRIYFVSKAEVAAWPGIGWLARATGTVFIKRDRTRAKHHVAEFQSRLAAGHKLLFFPEGTSTDGLQVLPFKPTLFAAFLDETLKDRIAIQPVTIRYTAPPNADPRLYGWWGDMDFGPHLLATLAAPTQGAIDVILHDPVRVAHYADRKTLAADLETQVRAGLSSDRRAE
ncbi:MAG: lysophospholipid acyltransferase family protein [Pseudomonadota bacterium]